SANRPSVCVLVSHRLRLVKLCQNGSLSSITNASSLITMHAAFSSVNCRLNSNPSWLKNAIDRFKSRTARLTNSLRFMVASSIRRAGGNERAQSAVAQPQAAPQEQRDVDRKQDVAQQRIADPHVGRDRAAEVAGPQN